METNRIVEGLPEPEWIEEGTENATTNKKQENGGRKQMTENEEFYKLTFSQREGKGPLYQSRCA